jgi:hypothetical protein
MHDDPQEHPAARFLVTRCPPGEFSSPVLNVVAWDALNCTLKRMVKQEGGGWVEVEESARDCVLTEELGGG